MTNPPDPKTKTPRMKRLCLRILSSLSALALGWVSVEMIKRPDSITALVMVALFVAIYGLDQAADAINPFHE